MLKVRLVEGDGPMLRAAQELRYREFFPQSGGHRRIDHDRFDPHCRHLVVHDQASGRVMATCRLLDRGGARRAGGFYTEKEFALPFLNEGREEVLEIGRFCVDQDHRQGFAPRLLWQGLAECIERSGARYLFGCVSLPGLDPNPWRNLLQRLWKQRLAPADIRPVARPSHRIEIDPTQGRDDGVPLLPLIKAYLRAGAYVGEGAVLDVEFSVIDICMVARTGRMISRYVRKKRLL